MSFWIYAGLLTVIALLSVVIPLFWKKQTDPESDSYDKSVYRDQLDEIAP